MASRPSPQRPPTVRPGRPEKIAFGDRLGETLILADISGFYREQGFLTEALELATKAVEMAKEMADAFGEATALVALGGVDSADRQSGQRHRMSLVGERHR